jgi:hypothetical protein
LININGLGAFGISPYLSDDLMKQAKYSDIRSQAGKVAFLTAIGEKRGKPRVEEGVHKARGALKWIASILEDEKEKK